jgi:hypothetical protein
LFPAQVRKLALYFGRKEDMGSKRRSGEVKKLEIRISNYELKVKL